MMSPPVFKISLLRQPTFAQLSPLFCPLLVRIILLNTTLAHEIAESGATQAPEPGFIKMTAPWIAGRLFGVVPPVDLTAVPDNNERWFAITSGKYIGLTKNAAISSAAVKGISGALQGNFTSQAEALQYFNEARAAGAVSIVA